MLVAGFEILVHIFVKVFSCLDDQFVEKMGFGFDVHPVVPFEMLEIRLEFALPSQHLKVHAKFNQKFGLFIPILQNRCRKYLTQTNGVVEQFFKFHFVLVKVEKNLSGNPLQHFLYSYVVVFLHELVILLGKQERCGVERLVNCAKLLVKKVFMSEIDASSDVVVELAWFEGVVVSGSVSIRPQQFCLLSYYFFCFLPSRVGEVHLHVLLNIAFGIQVSYLLSYFRWICCNSHKMLADWFFFL